MKTIRPGTLDRLGLAGRLLLTSDGTVMPMLEQIVGERVVTAGLRQSAAPVDPGEAALFDHPGPALVTRTTHLVGAVTGTVYVRARSVLCPDAMPDALRADLLTTAAPIGRLLRGHRVESFREILSMRVPGDDGRPAEPSRRYLVFIGGRPALLIEETFTAECFSYTA
ncbi:chorismate--pyruvate lyase family protein [Actinomadura welshii]